MNRLNFLAKLLLITAVGVFLPGSTTELTVSAVFGKYNFRKRPGLLQFWACTPSDTEGIGFKLKLTDQFLMSTADEKLKVYRRRCLENHYPVVELETNVGNWLAGRAAQTKIADHRTIDHADIGHMGQLVLPVFNHQDVLLGIIEFVTPIANESYFEDFEQIKNLLEVGGLKSSYMGKMIKVYKNDWIKFPLPLSATFTYLQREVEKRFPELKPPQNFYFEYEDTERNRILISSNEDLRGCMDESSSTGAKFIRMWALLNT